MPPDDQFLTNHAYDNNNLAGMPSQLIGADVGVAIRR
jgi:hypothetical protein